MSKFLLSEHAVSIGAHSGLIVSDKEGNVLWRQPVTRDLLVDLAHECTAKAKAGELVDFHLGLAKRCCEVVQELRAYDDPYAIT